MKMSIYLSVSLFFSTAALSQNQPIEGLSLSIGTMSGGKLAIQMCNVSSQPLRIFRTGNSWGDSHWRVLILRVNKIDTLVQNFRGIHTRNFPEFQEVRPGDCLSQTLDLLDGNWVNTTEDIQLKAGEAMVVIYDVPKSNEAIDRKVWYGFVAALKRIEGSGKPAGDSL
jgi:hypothetical protein